jgi:soluble lytic murein transglycosylase-like protein
MSTVAILAVDDRSQLIALAKTIAAKHSLDPALACAVCEHESNWHTLAIRDEPAFFKRYIHPARPDNPTTKEMGEARSFGLMQIMGETAEELGFKPAMPEWHNALCRPELGIECGCRKLAHCMELHAGDVRAALLAYNGGSDPAYPDLVLPLVAKYREVS